MRSVIFALAAFLFLAPAAVAQSAGKIVNQAVKAMGGEQALRRVTSWEVSGVITRKSDGATGRFKAAAAKPNLYTMNFEIAGIETGAGFTGKSSWRRDRREGLRTLTGDASDDFQAEAFYHNNRWLDYRKHRAKLVYSGMATVSGKPAHAITMINARGVKIKMFFDAASGLLVKEEAPSCDGVKTFEYRDHRLVEGLMEPFAITLDDDGERYEIRLERVTRNQRLDHKLFDFPRRSEEPLPDLDAIFDQLRQRQTEIEKLREKYAYTETATSYQPDKSGQSREKESESREMTFYRGHRIWRIVAKNGKPLSGDDQAKEDRRVEKMIRDIEAGRKIDLPHNQRRTKISDLLRAARFSAARRERFRNRDVIVADFEPNPDFKPANSNENFVHNLAGSIWIDEKDLQIARVEFQLVNAFKVAGGALFAMRPGSRFVAEQDRFFDEVWLPTYTEVTISARAMLFASFGINQKVTYGDYRRFDVKSEEGLNEKVIKP
jgi:outer membrane lipoprotein-sorting protein